jgi:alpha-N-arabinofuranosidase
MRRDDASWRLSQVLAICLFIFTLLPGAAVRAQVNYQNPVLPGFYSDPSICRVGDDYYMVHSSFGYFPGVPIFHSRNLVNWDQIGHVLTTPKQVSLKKAGITLGIFAPTLRCHQGVFYLITTNITDKGNFYVTATDPRGPWSDPVWIATPGIDPSLFFDDDGRAYVTSTINWGPNIHEGIHLSEIDIKTGKLLTQPKNIWAGTGGRYPEGPHIYKKDGWYYLMIAEGGTEFGHKVTIARSRYIDGPYVGNPANPILTHANMNAETSAIQGVGHGDLVQARDGAWFIVAHAFRQHEGHHILGRETFLAPVQWDKNAWPIVNGDGTLSAEMTVASLPGPVEKKRDGQSEQFNAGQLDLRWNYLHEPVAGKYSLSERKGYLRLYGNKSSLGDPDELTFIGRRQQHFDFDASASIEFDPASENEEAGMTLFKDARHFYTLTVMRRDGRRVAVLRMNLGTIDHRARQVELAPGPVTLRISGSKDAYAFAIRQAGGDWKQLGGADTRYLSSVTAGGFTGVYIGLYSSGNGKAIATPADVDWFAYEPKPVPSR